MSRGFTFFRDSFESESTPLPLHPESPLTDQNDRLTHSLISSRTSHCLVANVLSHALCAVLQHRRRRARPQRRTQQRRAARLMWHWVRNRGVALLLLMFFVVVVDVVCVWVGVQESLNSERFEQAGAQLLFTSSYSYDAPVR